MEFCPALAAGSSQKGNNLEWIVLGVRIFAWPPKSQKIARRTTGAKDCFFFLLVPYKYLKHILKVSSGTLNVVPVRVVI